MSAVIEREVSEGFPVDGRRFEVPQASIDNQKPRYVAFLGNLVERQAAMDKPWQKGAGGISVANPCLRYVKNFIRKGRITPVLMDTHDFRPADLVKKAHEGDTTFFAQQIPPGYVAPLTDGGVPSKVGYMMGKACYPGEQINAIVNGTANILNNQRRGIVELRSLQGQPYNPQQLEGGIFVDPTIWEIQRTIFPNFPHVPTLIDEVGKLLSAAKEHTMIREIVDDFLASWEQFREYADSTIKKTHVTMREIAGASNGYIPTYTAMDLVLLEQLGLSRQDDEIRKNAAPGLDPEFVDLMKGFIQSSKEEREAMTAMFKSQTPTVVDQNTMAAAPINEPVEGYSGYGGQSGYSGYSGEVIEAAVETAEVAAVNEPEVFQEARPLKGFAKINHDRKVAREAAARAAQEAPPEA